MNQSSYINITQLLEAVRFLAQQNKNQETKCKEMIEKMETFSSKCAQKKDLKEVKNDLKLLMRKIENVEKKKKSIKWKFWK